jgi:hypothetical protein
MKSSIRIIVFALLFINSILTLKANPIDFTLDTIQNYKNWGWEALVIQNEYITVAIVPEMGGNILQYDFGKDTLLLLEPNTFGKSFAMGTGKSPFDGTWGFGGFQTWPTPEAWPPPPNLTYRTYSYTVETSNSDSITIFLKSEKEISIFPGLQFERKISVYNHSTRVKIENKVINQNPKPAQCGIMNVSYFAGIRDSLNNYADFRLNFPLNPASNYKDGIYFDPKSKGFLGQTDPGIYTIEYNPTQGKIYADVKDGWASFTDKKDDQCYLRVFDVFEGETYPDNGARFEVYLSVVPHFMALEVMSPIKDLTANGGNFTFADNLFSTKLNNTIFKATHAGASSQRLSYDSLTNKLTGILGVFYKCEIRLSYYDKSHHFLSTERCMLAYPDSTIFINETVHLPSETNFIELGAYQIDNHFIDILDQIDFSAKDRVKISRSYDATKILSLRNNVIKNGTELYYQVNNLVNEKIKIDLYNVNGKNVCPVYRGSINEPVFNNHLPIKDMNQGLYFIILTYQDRLICEKIVVCK